MAIEERLKELGIALGPVPLTVGAYVPAVRAGSLVWVSGQLPWFQGKVGYTGKVGREVPLEEAVEAARLCAVNGLAAVKACLGGLDGVEQVVRVEVYVNSAEGFRDQPKVANGASELLQAVFGDGGQHTRVAVGVAELPKDASVELAMVLAVR